MLAATVLGDREQDTKNMGCPPSQWGEEVTRDMPVGAGHGPKTRWEGPPQAGACTPYTSCPLGALSFLGEAGGATL